MWSGEMILGRLSCPQSYVKEYGVQIGINMRLNELCDVPVIKFLEKTKNIKNIVKIEYDKNMEIFSIYWKIPEKQETLFWLMFSNESGIEKVDEI